jgi:hypothetical protein
LLLVSSTVVVSIINNWWYSREKEHRKDVRDSSLSLESNASYIKTYPVLYVG